MFKPEEIEKYIESHPQTLRAIRKRIVAHKKKSLVYSPGQQKAIDTLKAWYKGSGQDEKKIYTTDEFDPFSPGAIPVADEQMFVLSGYAGTGKTTVVANIKEILKIDSVAYIAFTGKAASVLQSKIIELSGADFSGTMHGLMYILEKIKDGKLHFRKKYEGEVCHDLIVVDEASMVNEKLFSDVLSFGIPVVFLGDNKQLEPVGGESPIDWTRPNYQLTEIHRTAENNPITRLSRDIREGKFPDIGKYSENVWILDGKDTKHTTWVNNRIRLKFDIDNDVVLCGYNKTRFQLNKMIRLCMGFDANVPQVGDRVICLKNNNKTGLFNGQLGIVQEISDRNKELYSIRVLMNNDEEVETSAYKKVFGAYGKDYQSDVAWLTEKYHTPVDLFDYGYAITVHKSQGSEFNNVFIYREKCQVWDQAKWDYTAVTRAKENLYIIV